MIRLSITSREEARNVLECLSTSLIRAMVSIAITNVRTSRDLANALGMSIRNSQRIINVLKSIKAIKVITYGRQKLIIGLNPYFEKEVTESIKALVPILVDTMRLPIQGRDRHYREVVATLTRILGINGKPKEGIFKIVRDLIEGDLNERRIPSWLKRIINAEEMHRLRIESARAKQSLPYSDIPSSNEPMGVSALVTFVE